MAMYMGGGATRVWVLQSEGDTNDRSVKNENQLDKEGAGEEKYKRQWHERR